MKANIVDSYNKIFNSKNKILIITAHPDDAEINAGGLIARLISNRKQVRLVVVTDGINGSKNKIVDRAKFSQARLHSQMIGAITLGISKDNIFNLGIEDGKVENTIQSIEKLVFHIRDFQPDIVITHAPEIALIKYKDEVFWVNHRDHRNVAQNVIDAVYPYSRDTGFFIDHINQGLKPHIVEELLFFEQFSSDNELYIDISRFIIQKRKALNKHKKANVLSENDIKVFVNENKENSRYYERFGIVKVNRLNTI